MVSIRRRRLIESGRLKEHRKTYVEGIGTSNKKVGVKVESVDCSQSSISEPELKKPNLRRKINKDLSSLRGVYFKNMKWQAAIKVGKKQIHLGTVATKEDAAHLYDRAAYKCGREPNFELSEQVKRELDGLEWDDFLELTRKEIVKKKLQKRFEIQETKRSQGVLCNFSVEIPNGGGGY